MTRREMPRREMPRREDFTRRAIQESSGMIGQANNSSTDEFGPSFTTSRRSHLGPSYGTLGNEDDMVRITLCALGGRTEPCRQPLACRLDPRHPSGQSLGRSRPLPDVGCRAPRMPGDPGFEPLP